MTNGRLLSRQQGVLYWLLLSVRLWWVCLQHVNNIADREHGQTQRCQHYWSGEEEGGRSAHQRAIVRDHRCGQGCQEQWSRSDHHGQRQEEPLLGAEEAAVLQSVLQSPAAVPVSEQEKIHSGVSALRHLTAWIISWQMQPLQGGCLQHCSHLWLMILSLQWLMSTQILSSSHFIIGGLMTHLTNIQRS